jgi:uncharacterized protein YndB with AHSA1/START domain
MHFDPDDLADTLDAVRRELRETVRDGVPMRQLVAGRSFAAPADDVWSALTEPERIPRWLLPVTGDLRLGGRYQLEGNAGGEVLACEPPRHLAVTWEYGDQLSWVDVTLTPVGDGTRLELTHDAPVDPQQWREFGPGAVGIGWELMLLGLHRHVATDEVVDPAGAAAWMQSAQGSAFMAASSRAWCTASIEAGEDPEQARAAEARCIAAYSGAAPES